MHQGAIQRKAPSCKESTQIIGYATDRTRKTITIATLKGYLMNEKRAREILGEAVQWMREKGEK